MPGLLTQGLLWAIGILAATVVVLLVATAAVFADGLAANTLVTGDASEATSRLD